MKQIVFSLFLLLATLQVMAQKISQAKYDLIPKPTHLEKKAGFFKVGTEIKIIAPDNFSREANLLRQELLFIFDTSSEASSGTIHFLINKSTYSSFGKEGYRLLITPNKIKIEAAQKEGAIHGLFTLIQLQQIQPNEFFLPCLQITDTPRFVYRGMHLDVSRHFFPVAFIKKFIDLMALYKLNTFHWHLTDAQGWRLQIKKYPKLTSMAAWRTNGNKLNWHLSDKEHFLHEGDPNAYGGYYTQKEAKEVVVYAAKRGITVIPEIEMPAHSEEVLAVYPHLSCLNIDYRSSEYCIGYDSTFIFLKDVLTEVMDIFPSKFIHIGGDEAPMRSWKTCPRDQALMKKMGFTDVAQLQSYAVKKIEKFLNAHGRKLLGWDEILKGGLAPEATVMSWRGEAGGIAAARQGHDVIMTPGGYCYFDHYQSDPNTQPKAIGGYIPLRKVYRYNPVPEDSLTLQQQKHILGVQANLWTEYIPTTTHVEYMAFPRMLALAEVAWTADNAKNFPDFHRRLQSQYRLLQRHHVNYYRPSYRIHIQAKPDYVQQRYQIAFHTEQYEPTVFYTLDGTKPDQSGLHYTKPFYTKGSTTIKAVIYKDGRQMDNVATYTANYHKAIGRMVTYHNGGWSNSYPAQYDKTLTNGVTGSLTYQDKQWQGFLHDMDVTVDMGSKTNLHKLSIRFMQLTGPGVYIPNTVTVFTSRDGAHYKKAGTIKNNVSPKDSRLLFKTFIFVLSGQNARYIRVKVDKQRGFMFTDEIVIN